MFTYSRKSSAGCSLPNWLKLGPILVKPHVRNKNDPLLADAELLEVSPAYGTVRLTNSCEINVSLRDLAHAPVCEHYDNSENMTRSTVINENPAVIEEPNPTEKHNDLPPDTNLALPPALEFHRSERRRVPGV